MPRRTYIVLLMLKEVSAWGVFFISFFMNRLKIFEYNNFFSIRKKVLMEQSTVMTIKIVRISTAICKHLQIL